MNGRHVFLEHIDLLLDLAFFGCLFGKRGVDSGHFLAVGQFAVGHDALDCRYGAGDALTQPIGKRKELLLALLTFLVVRCV